MADGTTHDEKLVERLGPGKDAFLMALLRTSPDCIKVLDREGRIKQINYGGICVMEIDDPADVVGKCWWDLWPDENRDAIRKAFRDAMAGKKVFYTGEAPTRRGTMKRWRVRATPMRNANGTLTGILAVSRDVTHF